MAVTTMTPRALARAIVHLVASSKSSSDEEILMI
jgi:hypothetical protein